MKNDTVYRYLGGSQENGILACGYMEKTTQKSQIDFCIPYYSVFYLLEGRGEYWDETGFKTPLGPGSVVQRLPGRIHSTRVEAECEWREFFISFGAGSFAALAGIGLLDSGQPVMQGIHSGPSLAEFDRLLAAVKAAGGLKELQKAQALAVTLVCTGDEARDDPMEQAKTILSANLSECLSEKQAALKMGMGVESFRKRFKQAIGQSPMEFRVRQKIMTARLMLLGGASVKEAALSLGYSDAYSFSKQFKKKTGVSPGLWTREKG